MRPTTLSQLAAVLGAAAAGCRAAPPPEQALPASAAIRSAPADADTLDAFIAEKPDVAVVAPGIPRIVFGYTLAHGRSRPYRQLVLIDRAAADFPFHGHWAKAIRAGDRIWALDLDENAKGPSRAALVYSADRGTTWWVLPAIPEPSVESPAQHAQLADLSLEERGFGSMTLHLDRDDFPDTSQVLGVLTLTERVRAFLSGTSVDGPPLAKAGDYRYQTKDFGQTWSSPDFTPPQRP